jgi:hypothetical protein
LTKGPTLPVSPKSSSWEQGILGLPVSFIAPPCCHLLLWIASFQVQPGSEHEASSSAGILTAKLSSLHRRPLPRPERGLVPCREALELQNVHLLVHRAPCDSMSELGAHTVVCVLASVPLAQVSHVIASSIPGIKARPLSLVAAPSAVSLCQNCFQGTS